MKGGSSNLFYHLFYFLCLVTLFSCSARGPALFAKKSPHEQYSQRIIDAGLRETALGRSWFQAAEQSLGSPLSITLPYQETGYFAAERPQAAGWKFYGKRGEKLQIKLEKKPAAGFLVYVDLWELTEAANNRRLLSSADTLTGSLDYEVKTDAQYILRVQPELLKSGEYNLSISTGPSLAFPISDRVKSNIGSLWGSGRDGGKRKHEGIDIFAPFRSPAVASADGVVTRVTENTLGGKVVFFRPDKGNYALYYAHLDTQMVREGQFVKSGDTLGLTGNTGNARNTPSHLHFGIYAVGGAVNPLPFVNPVIAKPSKITASLDNVGQLVRTAGKAAGLFEEPNEKLQSILQLENSTLLRVEGATGSWYKITMPDGRKGFIASSKVNPLSDALRASKLSAPVALIDEPLASAATITALNKGEEVRILAGFSNYYFVSQKNERRGWVEKSAL
jgi:murein DD-endopeptidase MepM/ murein hydrolase activator NlpD/SH3-like domain-containing protein